MSLIAMLRSVGGGEIGKSSGTTFPTDVDAGYLFTFVGNNRTVIFIYTGTDWLSIHSKGNINVYVDGVSGTDSIDKGDGTGSDAYKTIQYAIDQAHVGPRDGVSTYSIHLADSDGNYGLNGTTATTYTENIIIKNKVGWYEFNIYGTLIEDVSTEAVTLTYAGDHGTTVATAVSGTPFIADKRQPLYLHTDATFKMIKESTTSALTVSGKTNSTTAQNVTTYNYGLNIDGGAGYSVELVDSDNVNLYYLNYKTTGNIAVYCRGSMTEPWFYSCKFEGGLLSSSYIECVLEGCYAASATDYFQGLLKATNYGRIYTRWCIIEHTHASYAGVYTDTNGLIAIRFGTTIIGSVAGGALTGKYGVQVGPQGFVQFTNSIGIGYCTIEDAVTFGAYRQGAGGTIVGTSNNLYVNCGTPESGSVADFGYID